MIGFDVSVADKDKDGSFSWAAWGSGTKIRSPDRCGEFLLVTADTKFGAVSGVVAWKDPSPLGPSFPSANPSIQSPQFWRATVDSGGAYKATDLPAGRYSIFPVDSADVRVEKSLALTSRSRSINQPRPTSQSHSLFPGPLIGLPRCPQESRRREHAELDRFVRAYLEYFKIPGISVAVIKDSKVVYHRGFGVKNAATKEPVTRHGF